MMDGFNKYECKVVARVHVERKRYLEARPALMRQGIDFLFRELDSGSYRTCALIHYTGREPISKLVAERRVDFGAIVLRQQVPDFEVV